MSAAQAALARYAQEAGGDPSAPISGECARMLADALTAARVSRERCQRLQSLEDAICWRSGRLATPCADCASVPDGRCDDHGRDADLIAEYEQATHRLALAVPD